MARPRTPIRQRKNKNPNLPLGEGGRAEALTEEGRYQVRPKCRPTPVPGFARSTLSQERVLNLPHSTLS